VEGRHFSQDHELLGKIYEEVYGALDKFAEEIRTLDTYAPGIFNRFMNLSNIEQKGQIPSAEEMYSELMQDNQKVISNLTLLFDMLEDLKLYGFADFIGERIDAHNKHQWMLRSTLK
jgi:starvation-inducible DNA-binding protein